MVCSCGECCVGVHCVMWVPSCKIMSFSKSFSTNTKNQISVLCPDVMMSSTVLSLSLSPHISLTPTNNPWSLSVPSPPYCHAYMHTHTHTHWPSHHRGSCSGKSSLANYLCEKFPHSITIHQDDFYMVSLGCWVPAISCPYLQPCYSHLLEYQITSGIPFQRHHQHKRLATSLQLYFHERGSVDVFPKF